MTRRQVIDSNTRKRFAGIPQIAPGRGQGVVLREQLSGLDGWEACNVAPFVWAKRLRELATKAMRNALAVCFDGKPKGLVSLTASAGGTG